MTQQGFTSNKLSFTSIILGATSIITLLIINCQVANAYKAADGKTKLWFWITEMTFNYKYYFLLPAFAAVGFGIGALKREKRKVATIAISCGLLAIALVFVKVWKVMV